MARSAVVRRLVAVGCALALAVPVLTARADDLDAEKQQADAAVANAQASVDASTAAALAAQQRVADAQTAVADAQTVLDQAQADLAAAQLVSDTKAAELDVANQELAAAQAKEAEGQAKVDAQKDAVAAYARSIYQDSLPLVSVAALFSSTSSAGLADRIQWTDTVMTSNQVDLAYLKELHNQLVVAKAASQAAQMKADKAKQDADAQVVLTEAAKTAAADASTAMQAALEAQQQAQADADAALAADKEQLAAMQAEQADVNARIAEAARQAELARQAAEAAAAAAAVSSAGLIWPVPAIITDYYGYRIHPIWGTWLFHSGLDLGASCGTPIKAMADGRVTDEYYGGGYGYRQFIDYGWVNGRYMSSSYNHMSGYAVPVGTWVSQGQTVGYIGTTGNSTGCHLHLELYVGGSVVDPLGYLP